MPLWADNTTYLPFVMTCGMSILNTNTRTSCAALKTANGSTEAPQKLPGTRPSLLKAAAEARIFV
jgi:hypothetical protein